MTYTLTARNATEALPTLARMIMRNGREDDSRAGKTRELLYPHITLTEPRRREILTPGRHADITAQIVETVWVLSGRNDIGFIQPYLKRAADFSDDGKTWRAGYGPRLRNWYGVDQIKETVDILKQDVNTRRAVMSLWNPDEDTHPSKDIPCNNWLHFLVRDGLLNLHVVIRSNDLIWGWSGINAFEWSVLQELVASMVGVGVGTLEFSISSLHIYERHFKKAEELAALKRDPIRDDVPASPWTKICNVGELDEQLAAFAEAEKLFRNGQQLDTDLDRFPDTIYDPMIKSWLKIVQASYRGTEGGHLNDQRLFQAWCERPKSVKWIGARGPEFVSRPNDTLALVAKMAGDLHREKHAVYGDSWKKRGEQVSIQANVARKIDRLGKEGAGDNNLDTSIDLLCYLTKYALWLEGASTDGPGHADLVSAELRKLATRTFVKNLVTIDELEKALTSSFDRLLEYNKGESRDRLVIVYEMRLLALRLAALRYEQYRDQQPVPRSAPFVNDGDNGPDYESVDF